MTKATELHRRWMKDPSYRSEYEALGEEYQFARALIEARTRAGLSQMELAKRMHTSQSYMARIESGEVRPSTTALARIARATGCRLKIEFEPIRAMKATAASSGAHAAGRSTPRRKK